MQSPNTGASIHRAWCTLLSISDLFSSVWEKQRAGAGKVPSGLDTCLTESDAAFDREQEEQASQRVAEARNRLIAFSDEHPEAVPKDAKLPEQPSRRAAGASPERIKQALSAVKPYGGTNMYAAFDAAFRYRAQDLDTVYLLSDGLPNQGEGLTTAQRELKEVEQAEILGKHVRKTLKNDWNRALVGRPRVRINSVGFFYESPDLGAFLWALARENEGSFVGMSRP